MCFVNCRIQAQLAGYMGRGVGCSSGQGHTLQYGRMKVSSLHLEIPLRSSFSLMSTPMGISIFEHGLQDRFLLQFRMQPFH